jgi:uncharacterized protein YfdQ (DUF2303 family)
MLDKEAIQALQESASIISAMGAMQQADQSNNVVALPKDYELRDLEKYLPNRRRARGTMSTTILASFADYSKAHTDAGATVFIDATSMTATTVLNLGKPTEPGHADNRAKLILDKTAAYSALLNHAHGGGLKQQQVAEFLEDWPECIKCFNDAGLITPPKAIAAIRKITIEAMRKMENTEQQLAASKSTFDSISATSVEPLPTTIYFECVPYADLQGRAFVLRLGIQTGGDKPLITLRIVKVEQHKEDMANELKALIDVKFADAGIPVMLGSYEAKA